MLDEFTGIYIIVFPAVSITFGIVTNFIRSCVAFKLCYHKKKYKKYTPNKHCYFEFKQAG